MRTRWQATDGFERRGLRAPTVLLAAAWALMTLTPAAQAAPAVGTFSIVAGDTVTGEVGVAVQSRVFGVGPRVAWVRGGIGAIATQAQSNESFGPRGLDLLAAGLDAREALDWLLAHDPGAAHRQVGIIDARGAVATWTGDSCMPWAGDSAGVAFGCQGNILVRAEVVAEMARAFQQTAGEELARRLIAALEAGQAAGGDSRGRQSAAILVGRPHPEFPEYAERYVDIRIDDHATPIAELARLYEIYESQGLVQAHLRFAEWQDAQGDSAAARRERERVGQVLVRMLAQERGDAQMLNSLAWFTATHDIYLLEALIAAQRAVALAPEDSNILDTLAEVHFRRGEIERAIETAQRALELSPEDVYLRGQLSRFQEAAKAP
ncbi:MAG: DUF1028 domain-containing protein [Candidatus Eisenbacteria bacterium]|nr:DUF1028 domain-containing protein [Candidatus Eisenbacteria bacterium]